MKKEENLNGSVIQIDGMKKEKNKLRTIPDSSARGAIVWNVQVTHGPHYVYGKSEAQPSLNSRNDWLQPKVLRIILLLRMSICVYN